MNKNNWLTGRTTYPAGGDTVWTENNLAGQIIRDEFFGPTSSGAFDFGVTPGTYSITGPSVALLASRIAAITPGAYAISGANAALELSRIVQVTPGEYTLSGVGVFLDFSGSMPSSGGDYIITFRRRRR